MKIINTYKYSQVAEEELKSIIQSYIDFIKNNPSGKEDSYIVGFFEVLLNGVEIESIYEEKLKSTGRDIIKYLEDIKPIPTGTMEEQKLFINNLYNKLYNLKHPVRNNLFYMDCIPEIKEWLNKNRRKY